ncbi:unnamed protein product [Lathyrus sativus]|nr:unnamed protein product [Lathyrus sativus]
MNILRTLQGEYKIINGYGPDKAPEVLRDHWSSYITEDDFKFISQNGWNAFTWAQNHGIKVIVDLHAVKGSQNGNEHSGTRDGYIE